MIKLFTQLIDTTTTNTAIRDVRTLEDAVNAFVQLPQILPQSSTFQVFDQGGDQYYAVMVDYLIKPGA